MAERNWRGDDSPEAEAIAGLSTPGLRPPPRSAAGASPAESEVSPSRGSLRFSATPRTAASGLGASFSAPEVAPLLAAIRREVEASEERLLQRLMKVEQQGSYLRETSDRITLVEEKLTRVEARQQPLERRLLEVDGAVRGVTAELQALVKRISSVDERVSQEARRRGEESWKLRTEGLSQESKAGVRGTADQEDLLNRLNDKSARLQTLFDGLSETQTCLSRRLDMAEAQLESIESQFLLTKTQADGPGKVPAAVAEVLTRLEQEVADVAESAEKGFQVTERLVLDLRRLEVKGNEQDSRLAAWTSAMQAQGERSNKVSSSPASAAYAVEASGFQGLSDEVKTLATCINAAEAAVRSLAPRLLAAYEGQDGNLAAAANSLAEACRS